MPRDAARILKVFVQPRPASTPLVLRGNTNGDSLRRGGNSLWKKDGPATFALIHPHQNAGLARRHVARCVYEQKIRTKL